MNWFFFRVKKIYYFLQNWVSSTNNHKVIAWMFFIQVFIFQLFNFSVFLESHLNMHKIFIKHMVNNRGSWDIDFPLWGLYLVITEIHFLGLHCYLVLNWDFELCFIISYLIIFLTTNYFCGKNSNPLGYRVIGFIFLVLPFYSIFLWKNYDCQYLGWLYSSHNAIVFWLPVWWLNFYCFFLMDSKFTPSLKWDNFFNWYWWYIIPIDAYEWLKYNLSALICLAGYIIVLILPFYYGWW